MSILDGLQALAALPAEILELFNPFQPLNPFQPPGLPNAERVDPKPRSAEPEPNLDDPVLRKEAEKVTAKIAGRHDPGIVIIVVQRKQETLRNVLLQDPENWGFRPIERLARAISDESPNYQITRELLSSIGARRNLGHRDTYTLPKIVEPAVSPKDKRPFK